MAGMKKKSTKGKAPNKQPKQPKVSIDFISTVVGMFFFSPITKPLISSIFSTQGAAQAFLEQQQLLPPLERMAAVRPMWMALTPAERETLLTAPLDEFHAYAKDLVTRNRLAAEVDAAEALAAGHVVITLDPPLDDVWSQGIARSKECGTWKLWQWPPGNAEFVDSESFRKHLEENLLKEELRAVLPREPEGSRPMERPAEAAFRQRMTDLMAKVQEQRVAQEEAAATASKRVTARRQDSTATLRDTTIDIITLILSTLETEHESVYHHCLLPVTYYVSEVLPDGSRKTTPSELYPEDLECLLPDDVQRIFEFLLEKVDALSTRLKLDAKELEQEDPNEEPIGDVDLFSLTPDSTALGVNEKWMGHLRSRVLGDDSQPRRSKDDEDGTSAGLVLEWVYGTIVSTAEKGRDAAHRSLGTRPPSSVGAVEAVVGALEEQVVLEQQARASRDLLTEMLASRKENAALEEKYHMRGGGGGNSSSSGRVLPVLPPATITSNGENNIINSSSSKDSDDDDTTTTTTTTSQRDLKPIEDAPTGIINTSTTTTTTTTTLNTELPNSVVLFMLKREALLTTAKIHSLKLEQATAKRELRSYQAQLRAGEPQFERLKREMEELKSAPSRPVDGTFRNAADMERHRAQLADAAIQDQMAVQAAYRKTGGRLQKVLEKKTDTEMLISRRDHEVAQLSKWRHNVCTTMESLEDLLAAAAPLQGGAFDADEVDEEAGEIDDEQRALVAAVRSATHHAEELDALRTNFHTSFLQQLYAHTDDINIFEMVQKQLKEVERRLDDGNVAVQHLMAFAVNVACDDPGITIGTNIVLPYLQEKLDMKGLEWADKKAAEAQDEVIRMEVRRNGEDEDFFICSSSYT